MLNTNLKYTVKDKLDDKCNLAFVDVNKTRESLRLKLEPRY